MSDARTAGICGWMRARPKQPFRLTGHRLTAAGCEMVTYGTSASLTLLRVSSRDFDVTF